ncbi:hypothetical protein ILT44_04390 [Microvirga sp. BT689]|uniref:hypothetical protein n=1 Tax=Microvirga arvi TaxID=2778731 RepID=UPI0019503075|nr:hypothetical protein [Microvirga arvi]MBM6579413.1 hypothetical protein [Microvirga arvi]
MAAKALKEIGSEGAYASDFTNEILACKAATGALGTMVVKPSVAYRLHYPKETVATDGSVYD